MITQIYEIQTLEEAERCIDLGVDRIGTVILSEEAWRQPEVRDLIRLSDGTGTKTSLLPLFAGETLYKALDYYRPDVFHLCESLTDGGGRQVLLEDFLEAQRILRERFPEIGIVRSIPIPRAGILPDFPFLELADAFAPVSDYLLVDTWLGEEPVEGFVGITGTPCDWERTRELVRVSPVPVILAGGLSPENAFEAVVKCRPAGADSCTRTNALDKENRPIRFKKDFSRVRRFIQEVRRAERDLIDSLNSRLVLLGRELREREAALPAHSVRPHQLIAIEELEEGIEETRKILTSLQMH